MVVEILNSKILIKEIKNEENSDNKKMDINNNNEKENVNVINNNEMK